MTSIEHLSEIQVSAKTTVGETNSDVRSRRNGTVAGSQAEGQGQLQLEAGQDKGHDRNVPEVKVQDMIKIFDNQGTSVRSKNLHLEAGQDKGNEINVPEGKVKDMIKKFDNQGQDKGHDRNVLEGQFQEGTADGSQAEGQGQLQLEAGQDKEHDRNLLEGRGPEDIQALEKNGTADGSQAEGQGQFQLEAGKDKEHDRNLLEGKVQEDTQALETNGTADGSQAEGQGQFQLEAGQDKEHDRNVLAGKVQEDIQALEKNGTADGSQAEGQGQLQLEAGQDKGHDRNLLEGKVQEDIQALKKNETADGSHSEGQRQLQLEAEKKMEEQLKAEIKTSLEAIEKLLDEKLGSVQTLSEAQLQNPLSGLEAQIKQLTNQLSSVDQKVSQEIEKNLKTVDSMQFAIRDELQEWKDLLEKKLSASQPTLETSHLEKKLEQLENSEKKMEEQLKAEIKNSLGATKMLLDEKLGSVQTQLEALLQNPLSGLETQIKQLTNQLSSIDQKVSQEIEKKLQTIHNMQFASRNDLQQWEDHTEKKLSTSQPTLENKLEQLENPEMEKLRTELDWRRARNNADDITLEADTSHPNLCISGDKKNLKHEAQPQKVPPNPGRFDSTICVLGSEGFSSGKHYWEVEVVSSTDWDLGVARKSIQRKGKLSLSAKEGFWALSQSGRDYWAKTDPWTRVLVQKKPKKIGVYLSYQEGQVTFFNVTDMSVLFTFNDCSFSEEVYPFFKNSHKETTMRICSIKED